MERTLKANSLGNRFLTRTLPRSPFSLQHIFPKFSMLNRFQIGFQIVDKLLLVFVLSTSLYYLWDFPADRSLRGRSRSDAISGEQERLSAIAEVARSGVLPDRNDNIGLVRRLVGLIPSLWDGSVLRIFRTRGQPAKEVEEEDGEESEESDSVATPSSCPESEDLSLDTGTNNGNGGDWVGDSEGEERGDDKDRSQETGETEEEEDLEAIRQRINEARRLPVVRFEELPGDEEALARGVTFIDKFDINNEESDIEHTGAELNAANDNSGGHADFKRISQVPTVEEAQEGVSGAASLSA